MPLYPEETPCQRSPSRPPLPPIDPALARRLDDPDHGGLPPEVAKRLLAQQVRIKAGHVAYASDVAYQCLWRR